MELQGLYIRDKSVLIKKAQEVQTLSEGIGESAILFYERVR